MLFTSDVGYLMWVWGILLNIIIFHVWSFQSIKKVNPTSMAYCFMSTCCFCCFCGRQSVMEIDENIKNLSKDVGDFNKEQVTVNIEGGINTNQNPSRVSKLTIDVIAGDNKKQSEYDPRSHPSINNLNKQINVNYLGTNIDGNGDGINALTPYSPSNDAMDGLSPNSDNDNKYHYRNSTNLEIDTLDLKNIKVIVYDINVLLSVAYTPKDALELIQTKPIEWMTNKYVRGRIFDFEHKRSELLKKHIEFLRNRGNKQICIVSNGFDHKKVMAMIEMLQCSSMIDMIYSKDNEKWNNEHNNVSVILLDIMSHFQCQNEQILFISNDLDQMKYLKHIELCSLYPVYSYMEKVKITGNLTKDNINELNKYLIIGSDDNLETINEQNNE